MDDNKWQAALSICAFDALESWLPTTFDGLICCECELLVELDELKWLRLDLRAQRNDGAPWFELLITMKHAECVAILWTFAMRCALDDAFLSRSLAPTIAPTMIVQWRRWHHHQANQWTRHLKELRSPYLSRKMLLCIICSDVVLLDQCALLDQMLNWKLRFKIGLKCVLDQSLD